IPSIVSASRRAPSVCISALKIPPCSGPIWSKPSQQASKPREDKMKKLTATFLFGVAFAALSSGAWAETKVQLVEVITGPQRTEFLKSQLAEFEKANPDIKVDVVSLPWSEAFEKFLSMVQAGQTPDIVEMPERWMGLYANNSQLEDLGPFMKDWDESKT